MTGLLIIALLAPLAVFGSFAVFIKRLAARRPQLIDDADRTLNLFVWFPLLVSYGLVVLIAGFQFTAFIQTQ